MPSEISIITGTDLTSLCSLFFREDEMAAFNSVGLLSYTQSAIVGPVSEEATGTITCRRTYVSSFTTDRILDQVCKWIAGRHLWLAVNCNSHFQDPVKRRALKCDRSFPMLLPNYISQYQSDKEVFICDFKNQIFPQQKMGMVGLRRLKIQDWAMISIRSFHEWLAEGNLGRDKASWTPQCKRHL